MPSITEGKEEDKVVIGATFKFVLYVSYAHRGDSLGLELCEALAQFNKANGQSNFEVIIRLSREGVNAGRWDQAFIEREVMKYKPHDLKRVWVCGPPAMSEVFEKAFFKINQNNPYFA